LEAADRKTVGPIVVVARVNSGSVDVQVVAVATGTSDHGRIPAVTVGTNVVEITATCVPVPGSREVPRLAGEAIAGMNGAMDAVIMANITTDWN